MHKRLGRLASTWLLLSVTGVFAQTSSVTPTPAHNGDTHVAIYRTQAGDTLSQFGQRYLSKPSDLRAVQDLNHLPDANRLPAGLALRIPRQLLRQMPASALVAGLSCGSVTGTGTEPTTLGTAVHEGDVLHMPAECHATLLLEDGALVRLPASATLRIAVLRKNALETTPEIRLDLMQGRVELDVPKRHGRTAPFEVRTPLAVMGIRGTAFRVGYSTQEQTGQLEVLEGVVNMRGAHDPQSRNVAEGLGRPVDRHGRAQPVEALLPPPDIAGVEPDNTAEAHGRSPALHVRLHPMPQAARALVAHAATANLDSDTTSETLHGWQWQMPRPGVTASFHRVTAVSPSGLIGQPRSYAFCTPQSTEGASCNVAFDTPLARADTAIALSFVRMDDTGQTRQSISAENLRAQEGRLLIQGLAPGHYGWHLSYTATAVGARPGSPLNLRESGAFELIALPAIAP